MASGASLCLGVPLHRLWAVRPGIYEDEKGRTWVTVVVRLSPSQRARGRGSPRAAHMNPATQSTCGRCQCTRGSPCPPASCPSPSCPSCGSLPRKKVQSDGFQALEVVDHGQIASTEQLILPQLRPGE